MEGFTNHGNYRRLTSTEKGFRKTTSRGSLTLKCFIFQWKDGG
jgi:hypothetical protein